MNKVNVAVVGATGLVGKQMLKILAERNKISVGELYPLASLRSVDAGKVSHFGEREMKVMALDDFDFSKADIALFSAGGDVSGEHVPRAAAAGCVVVDNSSKFRGDDDVPLVIAEVNPHKIADFRERNIVANPNCTTMQMLVALKPIYDAVGIARVNAVTYQAVSGAGCRAIDDLRSQVQDVVGMENDEDRVAELKRQENSGGRAFSVPLAFNVVPHIDTLEDNGYTREEMKMARETTKILGDNDIRVNATAARVPVFHGHAIAAHIETRDKITPAQTREILSSAEGVRLGSSCEGRDYPIPMDAEDRDEVFVGRIREDITHPLGLNLWIVSDNKRKGAALNAVQIAEKVVAEHLHKEARVA